ncbi:adenosylcobinamide-phosphate synthase CbiB [Roseateles oligotrophus]|uniref:Cobalamin biosynthesis protein CobD n=1 Tax=Roseateles oligotrophus TaxID=1769250 RepID=A0ABT2Y8D2_9BURK|nr:adenosylcobinamide-phosphate synthase CbiB [Roseateles oligotrophus]MCV2366552.1 adenosylcobinamide-phosphate synthase CbiB [Roseateles oligotrophus]
MMAWLLTLAMLVALCVDRCWGEPPARFHPVVAMGSFLGLFSKRLLTLAPRAAFSAGALIWCVGALNVGVLAAMLETSLIYAFKPWQSWPGLLGAGLLLGLLLKPMLAWRMLSAEVGAVEAALADSLPAGRARLSRLVSRDTANLSAAEVREAAIETLAENLNDSVVAPLFWFMLAGLPGAAIYRFANTADAMWGYRGEWEWAGKWAARADDLLSWLPARITGLLMLGFKLKLLPALWQQARRTPSPNSGWPMAAMALRLNLRLAKPGVYILNDSGAEVAPADIARAQGLALKAMLACALVLAVGAAALRGGL